MFIFYFELKHIVVRTRDMLEKVYLSEITNVITESRFPAYYDWYAEVKGDCIVIYRISSELFFEANIGQGMNDYEYYHLIYETHSFKNKKLIKREYCYELVRRFYNGKDTITIDILDIDIEYELDDFYKNVSNWSELRWKE